MMLLEAKKQLDWVHLHMETVGLICFPFQVSYGAIHACHGERTGRLALFPFCFFFVWNWTGDSG